MNTVLRGRPRECRGVVISNKMMKTVVVSVTRRVAHPLYGKILRRITKLKAHDAENRCQIGDRVRLVYTRPLSKGKHWRILEIMNAGSFGSESA